MSTQEWTHGLRLVETDDDERAIADLSEEERADQDDTARGGEKTRNTA